MPFAMDAVINHFWVLAILVNAINAWVYWRRAQTDIDKRPELKPGYAKLIRGFLIWMSVPWAVMGAGMTLGGIDSIADYFYPREGNQFVIAWWVSVWGVIALFSYWIWFKGGAETLVNYPAFFRRQRNSVAPDFLQNPKVIKLFWLVSLAGAVIAHGFIWTMGPR